MSKIKLQNKRRIMKQLKLYGKKEEGDVILVATVFFNEKGELIVNSEYPEIKEDLTKEIEWLSFAPGWSDLDILKHILNKIRTSRFGEFMVSERKLWDERLEFYGRKLSNRQHIATVYVDKEKKIIVEAEDPKVKEDLLKAIYWRGREEVPVFIIHTSGPPEEQEKDRKEGVSRLWAKAQRPGDPDFLEALCEKALSLSKKYGDYYLFYFRIVEE